MTEGPAAPDSAPEATPGRPRRRLHHAALSLAWKTAALILMGAGLLLITLRLSLPGISHYRVDIEHWLSGVLEIPVSIGALRADWSGWTPVLRVENVRVVQGGAAGDTVARFAHASFSIDLAESLRRGEIRPGVITLTGATFIVTRRADGSVTFTSPEQPASAGGDGAGSVLPWLLRHRQLRLRDTAVVWKDLGDDRPPLVFGEVEVTARNDGERHQFEGSLQLPAHLGSRLAFALDATGNIMTPAWSGEVFLSGEQIRPAGWDVLERELGVRAHAGSGGFRVWTTWVNARLQRADGSLDFSALEFGRGERAVLDLRQLSADVSFWRTGHGFDADVTRLLVDAGERPWPPTTLELSYTAATEEHPARVTGALSFLRLDDLLPLMAHRLPAAMADSGRLPSGALEDVRFAFVPDAGAVDALRFTARLAGIALPATELLPGVDDLDGRLEYAGGRGVLELDDDGLLFDYPSQLPAPLPLSRASGRLSWAYGDGGWQVDAERVLLVNDDLTARVRGGVRFRGEDPSPFVRLVAQVQRGRLAALEGYLPRGLLPPPVADWLRRGLPRGDILGGEVLLHGLLQEFPFDRARGRLQARVEVANVRLDYQEGWPALEQVHGYINFDGRGMEIVADEGRVQDSEVVHARAVVEDLGADEPLLRVSGRVTGATEQAVAFLAASPLHDDFAEAMATVQIAGPSELDLELDIPLAGDAGTRVQGTLRLVGNRVAVNGLRRGLESLSGTVDFTERSVSSSGLEALYLGRRLALAVHRADDERSTRIDLAGSVDGDFLLAHLRNSGLTVADDSGPALLADHAAGASRFKARLELTDGWRDEDGTARLSAASTLEGVAIALPAPVGKSAEEARPLHLEVAVGGDGDRLLRFTWGDAGGAVQLAGTGEDVRVVRGVLLLGARGDSLPAPSALPAGEQLRVAGEVGRLSLNDWYEAINARFGGHTELLTGGGLLDRIDLVQLHGEAVEFLEYRLDDVRVDASRDADGGWSLTFAGPDLAGHATLPAVDGEAWVADLQRLALHTAAANDEPPPIAMERLDPGALPPLVFDSESLRVDALDLGRVALRTRPVAGGLAIERVAAVSPAFALSGSGRWLVEPGDKEPTTSVAVQLDAERLGEMLAAFGYAEAVVDGSSTSVEIDAAWPGAPADFSLAHVEGTLRIVAGPGRLLEVSPGAAGRVFGLLSLGSLPRRLRLDFGDLFDDGFSFERIEGKFAVSGGNAYTNDLSIDGTAARLDVSGRTGLVDRDYDQLVTVTPRLASTLPLAGAVLGPAGAGVGAVIWLAEKVFQRSLVDQVAAYRYTITGSWEDPQVEREKTPARSTPNTDDRG